MMIERLLTLSEACERDQAFIQIRLENGIGRGRLELLGLLVVGGGYLKVKLSV
ncbi:MAG: hypothetical protein QXQ05_12115 [Candidatus Jordarchaeales archaeon]